MSAADTQASREGHGWWPYIGPYFGFLAVGEIGGRMGDAAVLPVMFLKLLVPLGLVIYFFAGGSYPELRGERRLRLARVPLDFGFGVLTGIGWMLPFVLIPALRPEGPGFDPAVAGAGAVGLVLSLRMLGYAVATPVFEEIFIRSFVMRYAAVWSQQGDFRDVEIARYTRPTFWVTTVVFTIGHVPWEWWVCVPWIAATNWWFYRCGNLWSLIVVHSGANASILLSAIFLSDKLPDPAGGLLSFWYFV